MDHVFVQMPLKRVMTSVVEKYLLATIFQRFSRIHSRYRFVILSIHKYIDVIIHMKMCVFLRVKSVLMSGKLETFLRLFNST